MADDAPLVEAFSLRPVVRAANETHDYIHDQGFLCHGCQHRHHGEPRGFKCTRRCPCLRTAPTFQDFEFARRVVWQAEMHYVDVEPGVEVVERAPPARQSPPRAVNGGSPA